MGPDPLAIFFAGALLGASISALALARAPGNREVLSLRVDGSEREGVRVVVARGLVGRLVGLLNHARLQEHDALLLRGTRSVHTHGMGFPIDVVFLDRNGRVLSVHASVAPGAISRGPRGTRATLELAAGAAAPLGLSPGSIVTFQGPEGFSPPSRR